MSGSPSRAAASIAVVALLLWPALAAAQTAADPSSGVAGETGNGTGGEAAGPPVVLTLPGNPATEPGDGVLEPPPPAVQRAPEGIEVDPLGAFAGDYGGTLDPGEAGFPVDMWRGTDRAFVERLLPQLDPNPESPSMRELTRRLLLSSAEAPSGEPEVNLTAVRAERLMALGDRADAAKLLEILPRSQADAATARLRLEAAWLAGQGQAACADVEDLIRRFDRDVYLQKAHVFCQAEAGQMDQAALGLDLLREQGHTEDQTFYDLMGVLTGLRESAEIESVGEPRGLHLAMIEAAGQSLPADAAGDTELLRAALQSADGADRLAATERAVAVGLAGPDLLVRRYREEATTPEEVAAALDLAPDTPHDRAVLYQAAAGATVPTTRARLVEKALEAARQDGSYLTAARVYLPLVAQLEPAPPIAAIAGEAGRVLYLGGRYERAAAWLDLARAEAAHNPDAAAALPELLLLARIGGDAPPQIDPTEAWQLPQAVAGNPGGDSGGDPQADEGSELAAARLLALIEGLGGSTGAGWQALAEPGSPSGPAMPDAATWFALGDAAAGGRLGETVMLALLVLGPEGPGGAHPIALARALSALRQVGLDAEARALGVEAALANGV